MAEEKQQGFDLGSLSPGDLRTLRQMERDKANAQADASIKTAQQSPQRVGGGGAGQGTYNPLLEMLLGLGSSVPMGGYGSSAGGAGRDGDNYMREVNAGINSVMGRNTRAQNLQNATLAEQLKAAQLANTQARYSSSRGAGLGMQKSSGLGMGGGGGRAVDFMSQYARGEARKERAKDTRLDQELMREQMLFERDLEERAAQADIDRKLALYQEILKRLGGSQVSTSTTNNTGMEYQNIGGRPVAMPTQSSSTTRQETPTDRLSFMRSILGGI